MATNVPMFTPEGARERVLSLPAQHIVFAEEDDYWDAATEVEVEAASAVCGDLGELDNDAFAQLQKSVGDAVNNAWIEGFSHDEWVAAAVQRLRPSKPAHTPGPWSLDCGDLAIGGEVVCSARLAPEAASDGERAANMRLIAAAPDLLAALREICRMAGQMDTHRQPPVLISYDAIIAVRAAIAKAEG
jgi:hypothetical protein